MSRPTAEEFHTALDAAREMRARGEDPYGLARCFDYLHERNLHLEQVFERVEHFLRSGMAEREHTRLMLSLEKAREAEHRWVHDDQDEPLGL
ncbi:MAG TPA: hypothetical protein ENJ01_12100 [Gammaproteobacteria bacterium]|nr:hypothetical protein [Gammaproteobacteria bacterium]